MYRRDDEKLHCRDGEQAEHFSASQGAEQAGFSAQGGSEDVEDLCRRAGNVPDTFLPDNRQLTADIYCILQIAWVSGF